ncbi:hypothetical protein MMPV_008206 [Pyropia vietnamensis]
MTDDSDVDCVLIEEPTTDVAAAPPLPIDVDATDTLMAVDDGADVDADGDRDTHSANDAAAAGGLPRARLLDLPPEVLELVAAALLRTCYADVHQHRPTCARPACYVPLPPPEGALPLPAAGLVDAPTWAAAAPAAGSCTALRRALLSSVRVLALQLPTVAAAEADSPAASAAERYRGYMRREVGALTPTYLGRWLYFFPAAATAWTRAVTPALARFVRSCPALAGGVEVWDGHLGVGCDQHDCMQDVFVLRARGRVDGGGGALPAGTAIAAPVVAAPAWPGAAARPAAAGTPSPPSPPPPPPAAPQLAFAVSTHVGAPLRITYDAAFGRLATGVRRLAAAGGPVVVAHASLHLGHARGGRGGSLVELYACGKAADEGHDCDAETWLYAWLDE